MNQAMRCKRCDSPMPQAGILKGRCPRCMLVLGFESADVGTEHPSEHPQAEIPPLQASGPGKTIPKSIARYRILRLIGEGGMGSVYEAEQDQPCRNVAIKIIKPGLATPELLRRFEQESQALGRLQHPGIAQIFEAGTVDTGFGPQPYFAMELIVGCSPRDYAEAHRLDTRARVAMMVKICQAVHHAHQRGIIHRDLKPANILVDESGQPKVVDFGVARVTDSDDLTAHQTHVGQLIGTLAYMSPEQVLADPLDIDTRTDVYSLGVILYELLTGHLPFTMSKKPPENMQMIREKAPVRLSAVDRTYRGDVETIVLKTLEKDKTRRYGSATGMAADLQRFLNDEPIAARPPSASYQLKMFARRNRALVGSIAALFVVLVAGLAILKRANDELRQAQSEAKTERLITLYQSLAHASTGLSISRMDDDLAALLARQAFNIYGRLPGQPQYLVDDALQQAARLSPVNHNLLPGKRVSFLDVAYSVDGRYLAAASDDGTVRVWDTWNPESLPRLLPPQIGIKLGVSAMAFSPDGTLIAVGHRTTSGPIKNAIQIWEFKNPNALPKTLSEATGVLSLAFSPDGKLLAAGGIKAAGVVLWDVKKLSVASTLLKTTTSNGPIWSVAFSPTDSDCVAAVSEGSVWIWDRKNPGTPRLSFLAVAPEPPGSFSGTGVLQEKFFSLRVLAFSRDGSHIAFAGVNPPQIWDLKNPQDPPQVLQKPIRFNPKSRLGFLSLAYWPDASTLASADGDTVWLWDLRSPATPPTPYEGVGSTGIENGVAFSPAGADLATITNSSLRVWDGRTYRIQTAEPMHYSDPSIDVVAKYSLDRDRIVLSSDGSHLAASRDGRALLLWDLTNPEDSPVVLTLYEGRGVPQVVFSHDGKHLAVVSKEEKTVRLWKLSTSGAQLEMTWSLQFPPVSLAFSADDSRLAVGTEGNIEIWDLRHLALPSLKSPFLGISTQSQLMFSTDGAHLASTGSDLAMVRIWDSRNLSLPPVLLESQTGVVALAYSPDGLHIAAGNVRLNGVLIWDLREPAKPPILIRDTRALATDPRSVKFSSDGSHIIFLRSDGEVQSWPLGAAAADYLCTRVWRNLTMDEWLQYVGRGIPYERTCPSLPAALEH